MLILFWCREVVFELISWPGHLCIIFGQILNKTASPTSFNGWKAKVRATVKIDCWHLTIYFWPFWVFLRWKPPNECLFGPLNLDSGTLLRQNRQFKLESILTSLLSLSYFLLMIVLFLTNFYYLPQFWQFYDQLRWILTRIWGGGGGGGGGGRSGKLIT